MERNSINVKERVMREKQSDGREKFTETDGWRE